MVLHFNLELEQQMELSIAIKPIDKREKVGRNEQTRRLVVVKL
jgi:hypothetical protein